MVIGVFTLQLNLNIKEFDPSRCAMFGIEKLMRAIGVFTLQINLNIKEFDPRRCAMFGIEKLMRAIGISPNYGGSPISALQ